MPMPTSALASYDTLTAMITPAIFLTANGSLIISTSNRMSRIVDRIRALTEQEDRIDRGASDLDYPAMRLEHLHNQIERLVWRSDRIRTALATLYLAFAAFVGASLTLAFDVAVQHRALALPTSLALLGVALLLASCVSLVREAFAALRANSSEIDFARKLQHQRRSDGRSAAQRHEVASRSSG